MRQLLRRAASWAVSVAQALAVWFIATTFLVEPFRIWPTGSMKRTLLVNDFLFVNKLLYGAEVPFTHARTPPLREPAHGEIVVFKSIEEPGLRLVKRLVGLPGDTLAMEAGALRRNGVVVPEPYAVHTGTSHHESSAVLAKIRAWQLSHYVGADREHYAPDVNHWGPVVVPRDSLFFLGDNRDESYDGRYYGFVPRENVLGHPFVVYFSFDDESWRPLPFMTAVRWNRLLTSPD